MDAVSYEQVNAAWPASVLTITHKEAVKYALRLSKKFGDGSMPYDRSNHRNWGSTERTKDLDPDDGGHGWRRMIHDTSHWVHRRNHNSMLLTHSPVHAAMELAMIEYVLAQGWIDAKVVVLASRDEQAAAARVRLEAQLKRWLTKAKRAKTAIADLQSKLKRLDAGTIPRKRRKAKPAPDYRLVRARAEGVARRAAITLANKHDIELEFLDSNRKPSDPPSSVWPPSNSYKTDSTDPYEGDHTCEDWADALSRVQHYVGDLHPNLKEAA